MWKHTSNKRALFDATSDAQIKRLFAVKPARPDTQKAQQELMLLLPPRKQSFRPQSTLLAPDASRLNLLARNKGPAAFFAEWDTLTNAQQTAATPKLSLQAKTMADLGLALAKAWEVLNSFAKQGYRSRFGTTWQSFTSAQRAQLKPHLNDKATNLTNALENPPNGSSKQSQATTHKAPSSSSSSKTSPKTPGGNPTTLSGASKTDLYKFFEYDIKQLKMCEYYSLSPKDNKQYSSQQIKKFMQLFNKTYNALAKDPKNYVVLDEVHKKKFRITSAVRSAKNKSASCPKKKMQP